MQVNCDGLCSLDKMCDVMDPDPAPSSSTLESDRRFCTIRRPKLFELGAIEPMVFGALKNFTNHNICDYRTTLARVKPADPIYTGQVLDSRYLDLVLGICFRLFAYLE